MDERDHIHMKFYVMRVRTLREKLVWNVLFMIFLLSVLFTTIAGILFLFQGGVYFHFFISSLITSLIIAGVLLVLFMKEIQKRNVQGKSASVESEN